MAPGRVCWTSLETALGKSTINGVFLLKEEKGINLEVSGNKGVPCMYKIFPSFPPPVN